MGRALTDDADLIETRNDGVPLLEYLRILRCHWLQIVCLTLVGASAAVGLARGLPARYSSSATILVQQQQVPVDFVRPTVTSFADERISSITQRVMTAAVLAPLIERHGLYRNKRDRESIAELVDRVRRDITITPIDAKISDRASGQRVSTTVAFTIAYVAPDPAQAQAVVDDLVAIYLEENESARQRSVAATTLFLNEEAGRIGEQIKGIEGRLAEFKQRYQLSMPDAVDINLQLAGRTELELFGTRNRISILKHRVETLQDQLMLVPQALTDAETSPVEQLKKLRLQLAELRQRYSETHPDVQRLRRAIAGLESIGDGERRTGRGTPPDNPAYLALARQLDDAKAELAQLELLERQQAEKQRTLEERLLQAPETEREYRALTRDYENAQSRYNEIRAKEMQAEIAEQLEADQKAERFAVVEPASLPESPSWPRRKVMVMMGFGIALAGSVGLAWLRDLADSSVKSPSHLARKSPIPVLTPIPSVATRIGSAMTWAALLVAAATAVAAFAGVYLLAPALADRLT